MSKGEGLKIGIKFTDALLGDVTDNVPAFTITGEEFKYVNGPDNNGPLLSVNYEVESVDNHESVDNSILITMKEFNNFRNVIGNLNVKYDSKVGTLFGRDGLVESFEYSFTPEDLESLPNPGHSERVGAKVGQADIELKEIQYLDVVSESHVIGASVGETTISLKDVNDINP